MLTETAANILKLCINKSTHLELHITQRSSNIKDFLVSGFPSTNCYRLQVVHFYDNSRSCIEPQTKLPNDTLCRAASLKGQGIPSGTRCTWCGFCIPQNVTIWNLITSFRGRKRIVKFQWIGNYGSIFLKHSSSQVTFLLKKWCDFFLSFPQDAVWWSHLATWDATAATLWLKADQPGGNGKL